MTTHDGPARTRWEDADADRKSVAACIEQVARSQRENIAWVAIQSLRTFATWRCAEEPGSASSHPAMDSGHVRNMSKEQLRSLAARTPGINRKRGTSAVKWIHKTTKELKADLQSQFCVGRAGYGEKEREREQEDSNHAHADPKAVGVNSLGLREAMEKWIDQASMREGKALDIARAWRKTLGQALPAMHQGPSELHPVSRAKSCLASKEVGVMGPCD